MTTKTYNNTIVTNIDFEVTTEEGNTYRPKFNWMVTTDLPVDMQAYGCDFKKDGSVEGTEKVFTAEDGSVLKVTVRPAKVKPVITMSDAKAAALAARVTALNAAKPTPVGNTADSQDEPF